MAVYVINLRDNLVIVSIDRRLSVEFIYLYARTNIDAILYCSL